MFLPNSPAPVPSGSRRLTLSMLSARDRADQFSGVPKGSAKPLRYLAAFQEAEPYLGLPPQAFKLVAWLVKMTMPCDWETGSRPICWPSAARQAEFLALSPARVKTLNRALYEAGILILRDSPTGKRYGRRGPDGRIIEAYGFDLSPLAVRCDEFIRIAAEARAERERMGGFRRRVTIARRAIRQVGETLAGIGSLPSEWARIVRETAELVTAARSVTGSDELALVTKALEGRKAEAEALVRQASRPVDSSPLGLENEPLTISTNPSIHPKDTVVAFEENSRGGRASPPPQARVKVEKEDELEESVSFKPYERIERVQPGELAEIAPRLAAHLRGDYPGWGDIVAAASGGLCLELGVSQHLWGEACQVLGRQLAAITLAVVSTKPKAHFVRGAGGYFAAMVKRAKTGELHLDRSLWKLRRERWGA